MLLKKTGTWIDKRLGIGEPLAAILYKPIKGGARYMFALGFVNLFLFINQVLTGLFLMMYYVPSPDHAYDSVKYIQNEVSFGYMVRGLHYWGSTAMVVSVMLHVTRVFVFGAYKKPREPMWLTGAVMFFIVFGFAFTGYLLPWDQKSYWATVVGTNIPGTAPVLGNFIMRILRGGTDVSAITLTRFFSVHTMLLPWLLAAFVTMHLIITQIVDHTPPWDPVKARKESPFYPDQALKDSVMMFLVFAVMAILATVSPANLEALADPTDHNYNPRPEWYFYFLFQLLHYFEGPYEIVGTMVLPTLFVILLLLIPFIDRNPELSPRKRPVAIGGLSLALAGYIALIVLAATAPAPAAATPSATEGRKLYAKLGCASCHSIAGVGGKVGPPLDHVGRTRDRAWLEGHFKDPQKYSPGSVMPKFDYLSKQELDQLTDYMQSLK